MEILSTKSKGRLAISIDSHCKGYLIIRENPFAIALNNLRNNNDIENEFIIEGEKYLNKRFKGLTIILISRVIRKVIESNTKHIKDFINNLYKQKIIYNEESLNIAAVLIHRLLNAQNVNTTKEYCIDILLKTTCNAFSIINENENIGIGLYLTSSSINHSCLPNSIQRFDNNCKLDIISIKPIKRQDEILISYIDIGKSNWCRRTELFQNYGFICHCMKCCTDDYNDYIYCDKCKVGKYSVFDNIDSYIYKLFHSMKINNTTQSKSTNDFISYLLDWSLPYGNIIILLFKYFTFDELLDIKSFKQSVIINCNICNNKLYLDKYIDFINQIYQSYKSIKLTNNYSDIKLFNQLEYVCNKLTNVFPISFSYTKIYLLENILDSLIMILNNNSNKPEYYNKLLYYYNIYLPIVLKVYLINKHTKISFEVLKISRFVINKDNYISYDLLDKLVYKQLVTHLSQEWIEIAVDIISTIYDHYIKELQFCIDELKYIIRSFR